MWFKSQFKNLAVKLMGQERFEWCKYHSSNIATWTHLAISSGVTLFILYRGLFTELPLLHWAFAAVWFVGSLLDILDGRLARKYKVKPGETKPSDNGFGASLDEKVDKWCANPAFLILAFFGQVSLYFVIIMMARDVFVSQIRKREPAIRSAQALGKIKTVCQNATIIAALLPAYPGKAMVVFCLIALSTIFSLASAVGYLILALNVKNPDLLKETGGTMGAANWTTSFRIAITPIIPYIFIVRLFDTWSDIIGTMLMLTAILTDMLDGKLAKMLNQKTKAGAALDIIADKIIFYFSLAGLFVASNYTFMIPDFEISLANRLVSLGMILMLVAHDVLLSFFYFRYKNLPGLELKSDGVDRVRFFLTCAWIVAASFALTDFASLLNASPSPGFRNTPFDTLFTWGGFITLAVAMGLSIFTLGRKDMYLKSLKQAAGLTKTKRPLV